MTLADRLAAIVAALPEGGAVTLPVAELRHWLEDEQRGNGPAPIPPDPADDERWLTAEECAAKLSVSVRWCYDHARELGARRLSRRCVRFSERAVDRHMARRG